MTLTSSLRNDFLIWNVEMLFESCVVEVNDGRNTFLVIVVYIGHHRLVFKSF